MSDYISREAAVHVCEYSFWPENVKRRIKELPAADVVEVRHGKWVHNETYELANGDLVGEAYCTNCELYSSQISTPDGKVSYSVCPRCGAKMDGGDHDA